MNHAIRLFGLLALIAPSVVSGSVFETLNDTGTSDAVWGPSEVGWFYTPSVTYDLTGIETKFTSTPSSQIGVQLYSGDPTQGAQLLMSESYTPAAAYQFDGVSFSPITVNAGMTYFVGFTGTQNVGVNITHRQAGTQELPTVLDYLHTPSPVISTCAANCSEFDITAPILEFDGELRETPEPAFWPASAACLFLLLAFRTQRRSPARPNNATALRSCFRLMSSK